MHKILLNADLGEGGSNDEAIMPLIDIANIACGGHAGNKHTIRNTILLAKKQNIAVSAHPGYNDKTNFGRLSIDYTLQELLNEITNQLKTINEIASEYGCPVRYIKPHGALYHDASQTEHIANTLVQACKTMGDQVVLIGPPKSELLKVAKKQGFSTLTEGFIDRRYKKNGSLQSRELPDAVITNIELATKQALSIARYGVVECINGDILKLKPDTLCLHGDTPGAIQLARSVSESLKPYRQS